MREIYIFDIDGCVMPPIFSDFTNQGTREKIVEEVIENGNVIKLFPNFIKFYKNYCFQADSVFFITGRKKSEFGKLTENQLRPLSKIKPFRIIFYPETKAHKSRKYFRWKEKNIRKIIRKILQDISESDFIFNIFDDMNNYFSKIRKFGDKQEIKINLTLIKSENSWDRFLLIKEKI